MGVKASRKEPKKRGRDDWDDPPVKEWFRAKFVKAKEKDGDFGPGWNFQFKCIDKSLEDLTLGSIWGLQWEPCHPGRALYDWLNTLSDGDFEDALADLDDDDDELDFDVDDYTGKIVEVFCERAPRKEGGYFHNVTDIRIPKRRKKKRRPSADDGEEKPQRSSKKKRRRPPADEPEEKPARRKKRSSSRRSEEKEAPAKKKRSAKKRRPSY